MIFQFSPYARYLVALCCWREMRGVPAAWPGVIWVILNSAQALAQRFHTDMDEAVILEVTHPFRYSSMTAPHDPNLVKWPVLGIVWAGINDVVDKCLSGEVGDPTGGADHYFSLPLTLPPTEWGQVEKTLQVDGVQFWKTKT